MTNPPNPQPGEPNPGAGQPGPNAGPPPGQPYGQPGQPYAQPAAPLSPESDQQAAMWAHIGGIVGFLPSLIIWLILKDRGPRTNVEGKEALNWQISITIVWVAIWIISAIVGFIPFIGLVLVPLLGLIGFALWVLNVVWSIMGGVKVNNGGSYRYPINFRIIK